MDNNRRPMLALLTIAGLALVLALPPLARADGGPILSDPELWAKIDEGQQIAVVRLQQDGTAQVDLFISMADRTGQSHQVTFFVPLGVEANDFYVVEEMSLAFDNALTAHVEEQLRAAVRVRAAYKNGLRVPLVTGALAANGIWSWLIVIPFMLSSCGGEEVAPVATFETPSSQVAIYDMNAETDLQALIETTGLDPKVQETLAALQGQRIAVVKLQTQPVQEEEAATHSPVPTGQPGIHLRWRSTLVAHSTESTYTYPLGTGKAWASPIELTRVYVVSPPEIDFRVDYPRLGINLSGLERATIFREYSWRIRNAEGPAFAVDEAYGDFGHIWRATYVKSNSGQDLVVTRLSGVSWDTQRAIRDAKLRDIANALTWPISLLAGIGTWLIAWWVVIPRRLGVPYRWREWKLYGDALKWAVRCSFLDLIALVPCFIVAFLALLGAFHLTWLIFVGFCLPLLFAVLGLANAYLYARLEAKKWNVTRGRAFEAYMLVVLMANVLYLAFAAGYGALVGAI